MDQELLTRLTQAFGPPGYEDEIRAVIREVITPYADTLGVDPLGSLVAVKKGTGGGKRIILAAHMDEIGVMVTFVEEKGYLRFARMGGINPLMHIGGRVRFADGTIGVISVERREDPSLVPTLEQLFIDVGATSRDDVRVKVGDPGVFVRPLVRQGRRIISKTLDDRAGCYVLIEVLRQMQPVADDLYFLFSVQEEVTLSGARTSAYRIDPDLAVAVDVTATGDTPKALPMAVEMGKGPAIKIQDSGMIANPKVRDWLIAAAENAGIPYQREILLGGSTDASAIQLVRGGVPSGCVSVPCRYVHSPSEMIDAEDLDMAIALLVAALKTA